MNKKKEIQAGRDADAECEVSKEVRIKASSHAPEAPC